MGRPILSNIETKWLDEKTRGNFIPSGTKFCFAKEEVPEPPTEAELEERADRAWFAELPEEVQFLATASSAWSKREWRDWDLAPQFSALAKAIDEPDRAVRIAGNLPAEYK